VRRVFEHSVKTSYNERGSGVKNLHPGIKHNEVGASDEDVIVEYETTYAPYRQAIIQQRGQRVFKKINEKHRPIERDDVGPTVVGEVPKNEQIRNADEDTVPSPRRVLFQQTLQNQTPPPSQGLIKQESYT
jgi:hypothetical protein